MLLSNGICLSDIFEMFLPPRIHYSIEIELSKILARQIFIFNIPTPNNKHNICQLQNSHQHTHRHRIEAQSPQ